jgi:hypothetical protein
MPSAKTTSTELDIPDDEKGIETEEVVIFGEKFAVLKTTNFFNLLEVFDEDEPANLPRYLIKAIATRDRRRFKNTLAMQTSLTDKDLFDIFSDIMEAQGDGRPTESSSGSSNGSGRSRASTRSAAT